jgi:hypothetical protein
LPVTSASSRATALSISVFVRSRFLNSDLARSSAGLMHALLLQPLGEEEHAAQVLGGIGCHERDEAFGLALLHCPPVIAVFLEQVDQRVRRGIVREAGLLAGLGSHLVGDVAA